MRSLKINPTVAKKKLTAFIKEEIHKGGFKRAVIGLSGGLDSAVTAYLAAEALGPGNVLAVIMPYKTTPKVDIADAKYVCKKLSIKSKFIDITDMVETYFKKAKVKDKIRRGNKMARERMSILYDLSKEFNALVIGTGNKTEILLGYYTVYGDAACAIAPLGNLYKSQVIQLARFLKVPARIINKTPSAGLWRGQTDEGELGFSYKDMDTLLYYLLDKKFTTERLMKKGFTKDSISKIKEMIKRNRFKTQLPLIAKL